MSTTIRMALSLSLLLFLSNALQAQNRFQIGLGFLDDVTYLNGVDRVVVGDSLFFSNGPDGKRHSLASDPRSSAFVRWSFLRFRKLDLNIAVVYSKKYSNVTLSRTSDLMSSTGRPVINDFTVYQARDAFYVPLRVRFEPLSFVGNVPALKPLSTLQVSIGGGPVFSDNAKSPGDREEFSPGLFMQRLDPLFTEFRHQFINQSQRVVTFDYSFSLELKIVKGFGVQAMWSGSVGNVSKPIRVITQEVHVPLKRKSMHVFLTYSFDLF